MLADLIGFAPSAEILRAIVGIFVIVDPVGNVGVFLAVTRDFSAEKQRRAARLAGATVAAVLVAAALAGQAILDLFGVRLAAFSVAGGILFLILAIQMIRGEGAVDGRARRNGNVDLPTAAIVPLGVPLMAGPGAISTVILASPGMADWRTTAFLIVAICAVGATTWLCFAGARHIAGILGDTGIHLVSRLMGLVLAALAVEFMARGLVQLFPVLAETA